jgi:hypothetical protein
MNEEQKLMLWANAYNAALTGVVGRIHGIDIVLAPREVSNLSQHCKLLAEEALAAAVEKDDALKQAIGQAVGKALRETEDEQNQNQ